MEYIVKCPNCGGRVMTDTDRINTRVTCELCMVGMIVPLTPNTVGMVHGDLWIQKTVGSGNIADVFVAKRNSTNEKIYLKILSCAVIPHKMVAEEFFTEMRAWQQVDDPQVLSACEFGVFNGDFFFATRYVEGECLDERVKRAGPLPTKDALKIGIQVANILSNAWEEHGLIHRDIRPSNILMSTDGRPYILDAGNSKQCLIPNTSSYLPIDFAGDVADYLSPEQVKNEAITDCSSDIYSIGCTLYYMLSGKAPYTGSDADKVAKQHTEWGVAELPEWCDAGRSMRQLLADMMEPDRNARIAQWSEVSRRMKAILRRFGNRRVETNMLIEGGSRRRRKANPSRSVTSGSLRTKLVIFAFAAALAACLAGFWHVANKPDRKPPPQLAVPTLPDPDALLTAPDKDAAVAEDDETKAPVPRGPLWTPARVNTAAWYDAADPKSIIRCKRCVVQWCDKSGNGRHLKSQKKRRPASGARSLGGLNVIDFDGKAEYLATSQPATWLRNTKYTIIAVTQRDARKRMYILGTMDVGKKSNSLHVGWWDANAWTIGHFNDGADYRVPVSNSANITSSKFNNPGSELFFNGIPIGVVDAPRVLLCEKCLIVGNAASNPNTGFDGAIAEIVILTGETSTAVRQMTEGYLAHKWKLMLKLPSDHPYRHAPPRVASP